MPITLDDFYSFLENNNLQLTKYYSATNYLRECFDPITVYDSIPKNAISDLNENLIYQFITKCIQEGQSSIIDDSVYQKFGFKKCQKTNKWCSALVSVVVSGTHNNYVFEDWDASLKNVRFYCNGFGYEFSLEHYKCVTTYDTNYTYCSDYPGIYFDSISGQYFQSNPNDQDLRGSYHSSYSKQGRKTWLTNLNNRDNYMGIELEVCARNTKARNLICLYAAKFGFYPERDGSLNPDYGIEIVSKPYTLAQIKTLNPEYVANKGVGKKYKSDWVDFLECIAPHTKNDISEDNSRFYGLHINLNASNMTTIQRSRITMVTNILKGLGEFIGNRRENRYTQYVIRNNKVTLYNDKGKNKKSNLYLPSNGMSNPDDKYYAAVNRGDRIELRLFCSTVNLTDFFTFIEYADAVRLFSISEISSSLINDPKKLEFLFLQFVKQHRSSYPNLYSKSQQYKSSNIFGTITNNR